jgi:predicted dehydrogenase
MKPLFNRREFLVSGSAAAVAAGLGAGAWPTPAIAPSLRSPNDELRVACIGIRGRGRAHIDGLAAVPGVRVVALCDVDENVLATRAVEMESRSALKPKRFVDYRRLMEDRQIDAASIATPNHTHALLAIAAMEAGKDVYVEKPCSHNLWEGRQLVRAARQFRRVCLHGTQARSSPAVREAIRLVREGLIGQVFMARATCFQWRPCHAPAADEPAPSGVGYDLWLGPAPKRPFSRDRFHCRWRWHWEYGSGDLGNQGVHEIDLARWGLGVGLPTTVHAAGAQFTFNDSPPACQPLVAMFEYPDEKKMLVFETRPQSASHADSGPRSSNGPGVTFYGAEGYVQVFYFGYRTFLGSKREPGPNATAGPDEFERFIRAVRSRGAQDPGIEAQQGHLSAALCHLGNIAYRLGRKVTFDPRSETFPGDPEANALVSREYRLPHVVLSVLARDAR